ncbi:hypothetical protein [Nocardia sp. NBC_01388]|uniref:hypothetical protein n=1 Tax=Nocardia sp. NBC_01388 TaxID=2903596 RepID=UPI003246361C
MTHESIGAATLLQEEEEVLGDPSFELLVRDGRPIVSGSYFIHPPLRAVEAELDDNGRLTVRANDGTEWGAENVLRTGQVNVVLYPRGEADHPAYQGKDAR